MRPLRFAMAASLLLLAVHGWLVDPGATVDWQAIDAPPALCPSGMPCHWLGTDEFGRDVLALVARGLAASLAIVLASMAFAVLGGGALGVALGSAPRWVDELAARAVDLLAALPLVVLALVMVAVFGRQPAALVLALSLAAAVPMTRVVRVAVRTARSEPHLVLAGWQGLPWQTRLRWHLWPSLRATVQTAASLLLPQLLLAEGMLGFLGLSLRDPQVTLGTLLAYASARMSAAPSLVVVVVVCLFLTVFALRPRT